MSTMNKALTAEAAAAAAAPRPPRAAATIVVVRDGAQGLEVLLSRRAEVGDLNSGAWVFPGGVLDAADRDAHASCIGLDDAAASERLGLPHGGLDHYIAAVRECFEEAGLLFAVDASGTLVDLSGPAGNTWAAWRGPLHRGERHISELCQAAGLRLAVDRLVYLSHWLTPPGRAKRFDTRFFIAAAPPGQTAAHDGTELVEQLWLRPAEALAHGTALKLMTPTLKTIELLAQHASVPALLDWARAPREVPLTMPRVATGSQGLRPVTPDEHAWAEIGRLDPTGRGHASYELVPGRAVQLSPRLIRVTANNGNMMTGPGTNTYLVGGGDRNEWAVIDPGPALDEHVQAVLAAAPGPIRWIFATHTHKDHSPATVALQAHTRARSHGRVADHTEWQDLSFVPDVALSGGERFELPAETTLRVIHTPGHASNHLCYLLEQERLLFTGDHVMQASTVVINPPDGDMGAYLRSLSALLDEDLEWLAPGHGFLMAQPQRAIRAVIAHRGRREAKLLTALGNLGPASAEALLERVYDDVPQRLHGMAMRSLLAHLFKLCDEARATQAGNSWRLASGESPPGDD
jgi:glyoxylase-like metal-dependent hydrolase (beta-lactamase superfamily II)/8-oxo-dGTP pyrophosphatase MutT (NUDIX family)